MQKNTLFRFLLTGALAFWLAAANLAMGQGVTTSGISGVVRDAQGNPVSGAAVTIIHEPSGTRATAITRAGGQFSQSGLRVGGPYSISATADGYVINSVDGIYTVLGETASVTLAAKGDEVVLLEAVSVTASQSDLDGNTTGFVSSLDERKILGQPTSTRSFTDLIKTNPFVGIRAGSQVTALGMHNRYNSITLDGARLNDQFGLSSTGLFSLKNPFSLDALEQFTVSLTPYDAAESGFAGASINAVSKSGTNEFHGSAYYIYSSAKWQGEDLSGTNAGKRPGNFYERSYGATLGGPIIKNKLFFFVNYEEFENPGAPANNAGFTPTSAFLTNLDQQIASLSGSPDLGSFGGAGGAIDLETKRLVKLDWNISDQHRLTVRYSDTEGSRPNFGSFNSSGFSIFPSGTPTSYPNRVTSLSSSYYSLAVLEKVWAGQFISNWTPDLKTQFNYSQNDSTSLRSTPAIFPEIRIFNVPGTDSSGGAISSGNAISFGTEHSSMGNGIIMNGVSYGGNAEYTMGNFVFKGGFDREETDFDNLFRNGSYGIFAYNYSPTLNIATDRPLAFYRNVAQTGFPGTDASRLEQTGYFVQAKWDISRRLNATLGLRYDVLGSPIAPTYNPLFTTVYQGIYPGIRNDGTIDGTSRVAPRFSFNYALDDERVTQIRGGVGVFLGRNPWVWISNAYGNAGFGRFAQQKAGAAAPTLTEYLNGTFADPDPAYSFDADSPMGTTSGTSGTGTSVNLIAPGLKLPTNLRSNIALDRKIPSLKATFTVEYIYNQVMESLFIENLNSRVLNGDAQNNPGASSYGADGRLRYSGNLSSTFGQVLRLRNIQAGESHYVAFVLDRPFSDGWAYNASYTRGSATEAQALGSSTASSNWNFNNVFNRTPEVERSDYEIRDRVQLTVSKEFQFFDRLKSTISLYYEGRSGQPFSYVYSGDLNGDGRSSSDLVAVPTGASDARFDFSGMTSVQMDAYFDFLQSSGLSQYAGSYAPRNAFLTPWQNRLDLQFTQEIRTVSTVKLEFFANFMNFGSWLNDDVFNYIETLNGSTTNSNQLRQLGNAAYNASGQIRPTVTLNSDGSINFPASSRFAFNNGDSRWRIMGGVRLKF